MKEAILDASRCLSEATNLDRTIKAVRTHHAYNRMNNLAYTLHLATLDPHAIHNLCGPKDAACLKPKPTSAIPWERPS